MPSIRVEAVTGMEHWLAAMQGRIEAQFSTIETRT